MYTNLCVCNAANVAPGQSYRAYAVYFVNGQQRDTLAMDAKVTVLVCPVIPIPTTTDFTLVCEFY